MLANIVTKINIENTGYIAGQGSDVVTVAGVTASRNVWLLNAKTLAVERVVTSLNNGEYIFIGIDTSKDYIVLARDYKKEYEPFVWDYVTPADDLSIDEQQTLWLSFQN